MKTVTTAMLDLDRLVETEEADGAAAVAFVEAAVKSAARDQSVDETKLVAALRRTGKPAADFAAEVRASQARLADAARVAGIPAAEQSLRDIDAEQAADDAAVTPAFNAYYARTAARRGRKEALADDLMKRAELKRELYRTQPDGRLKNEHARRQSEVFRLERELTKLRDSRNLAESQNDAARYDGRTVEDARATLARTAEGIDRVRDQIEAAKAAVAAVEEEMSLS